MQTLKKKNEEKIGGGPKKKKKVEGDQRKKVGYGKGEVGEKLSGKVWLAIRSTSAIGSKKQRNAERKNTASHTKYLGNTKTLEQARMNSCADKTLRAFGPGGQAVP